MAISFLAIGYMTSLGCCNMTGANIRREYEFLTAFMTLDQLKDAIQKEEKPSDHEIEAARAAAAVLIQRVWRGKHNKIKSEILTADRRWDDAALHAQLAVRYIRVCLDFT